MKYIPYLVVYGWGNGERCHCHRITGQKVYQETFAETLSIDEWAEEQNILFKRNGQDKWVESVYRLHAEYETEDGEEYLKCECEIPVWQQK